MPTQPLSQSRDSTGQPATQLPPQQDTGRRSRLALRQNIESQCSLLVQKRFYQKHGKRLFDLSAASAALIVLAIPMLVIALLIRLDSKGPALFRQRRTGQFGRRFSMYKYRSMVPDAEVLKDGLKQHNVHGLNSPDFKVKDDPRVTRLGRLLRKTSLDELPNLLNVVTGEMSLVGPRPTSFDSSTYGYEHLARLSVKPGVTGLWQVSGRADLNFDERSNLDVKYMKDITLRNDLELIVKTLLGLGNGAY